MIIEKIIKNGNAIELMVHCPHCNQSTILFNEDADFCEICGKNIEQLNRVAWCEYFNMENYDDVEVRKI